MREVKGRIAAMRRKDGQGLKDIFRFEGYLRRDGRDLPIEASLSAPRPDPLWKDWYLFVYAPPFLPRRKTARGITAERAISNGLHLLKIVMDGASLIDKSGRDYQLSIEKVHWSRAESTD